MQAIYNSKIFNELDELEVANKRSQKNKEKLAYIGDIICRYNLQEIVGICLLHKHFYLQPNERVVREFIDNSFYTKPQIEENWDCVTPYLWQIKQNHHLERFSYYPLEFFRHIDTGIEIKKRSELVMNNREFLMDIAIKLSELKLINTFGIAILFQEFIDLEQGEFLLETTEDNRMQMFELTSVTNLGSDTAIQALWKFTPYQPKLYPHQESNRSVFWKFFGQK